MSFIAYHSPEQEIPSSLENLISCIKKFLVNKHKGSSLFDLVTCQFTSS